MVSIRSMIRGIGAAAMVFALQASALAQWTNNPASPLVVGDATSDIPIVIPHPDGGCYIAWQGPVGGNVWNAVHIQRLSAAGVEMWGHNGVVAVVGNNSASFVGDFDAAIASDGNLLVANCTNFSDAANPTVHQSNVQKFSAVDGSKMWGGGTDIAVTNGGLPSRPVRVCSTPDGGCIVGYTLTTAANKGVLRFRRLNSSGAILGPATTPAYASNPQIFEAGGNESLSLTGLIPAGAPGDPNDASFIALFGWKVDTGQVGLQTSKFTSAGVVAAGWGTSALPLTLDNHGLTGFNFYNFRMIPDGAGGAIYAWSTFANSGFGAPTDCVLQHVLSDGTFKFGTCCDTGPGQGLCTITTAANCASPNFFTPNGAPLNFVSPGSVPAGKGRYAASVDYDQATGTYYLGTEQGNTSNGVKRTVLVQKFNGSGQRQWGDTGFTVIPESTQNTQATPNWVKVSRTSDGGCMVFGNMGRGFTTINSIVYGAKVVDDPGSPGFGMFAWNKYVNTDVTTGKGRNGVARVTGTDDAIVVHTAGNLMRAARVAASNGAPAATSMPPSIDVDLPFSIEACDGDTIQLSVQVSGNTPMMFQWQRHYAGNTGNAWWTLNNGNSSYQCNVPDDGTTYSGTNTATLTIQNIHSTNPTAACPNMMPSLNQYQVVIYNAGSDGVSNPPSVTSSAVTINVGAGACCGAGDSGVCTSACNAAACTQSGGTYQGDFSTCSPNPCGGACCGASACTISGSTTCSGVFQGIGSACSPIPCNGSCCDNSIGACSVTSAAVCPGGSGSTFTAFASCSPNPCPQPGACCSNSTGNCTIAVPATCGGGNTFIGQGSVCETDPCAPSGACCSNIDGNYCTILTQSVCTGISTRRWQGANTVCSPTPCPQPGACCNDGTGSCTFVAQPGCGAGSTFQGAGAACDPNPCPQPSACCDASTGACSIVAQPSACTGQLAGTTCSPDPCPAAIACCQGTACFTSLPSLCGSPAPGGATTCSPSPCAAIPGVCCRGSTCIVSYTSASACSGSLGGALAGSSYIASGICNAPSNFRTPCCYADYNKTSGITVGDIFDFLNDWFAGRKFAIVGGDGSTGELNVQHIFDFLNDWFAGGC